MLNQLLITMCLNKQLRKFIWALVSWYELHDMTGQEIISKLSLENGRIAKRTAAYELMNPSRPSSTEILYLIHNLLGSELNNI